MGRVDPIKSDTDGFDLWIVAGYKFRPMAPFQLYQVLFYFWQKFLPIFNGRREDRPVEPLYEIVSIYGEYRDEVEPGGGSMDVFRAQRIGTPPDELFALFSCKRRVLCRL